MPRFLNTQEIPRIRRHYLTPPTRINLKHLLSSTGRHMLIKIPEEIQGRGDKPGPTKMVTRPVSPLTCRSGKCSTIADDGDLMIHRQSLCCVCRQREGVISVTYRISVSDLGKINYASFTHHTRYLLHFHPATSTIAFCMPQFLKTTDPTV